MTSCWSEKSGRCNAGWWPASTMPRMVVAIESCHSANSPCAATRPRQRDRHSNDVQSRRQIGPAAGGRAADWFRQAEADLAHARRALADGDHEWACFAAQQAAEKAAKAAHAAAGQEAWGHVVTELLDALRAQSSAIDDALLDRARALDK